MSGSTGGIVGDILSPVFGEPDPGGYKGENAPLLTSGQSNLLTKLLSLVSGQVGSQDFSTLLNTLLGGGESIYSTGKTIAAPYMDEILGTYTTGKDALSSVLAEFDPTSTTQMWETSVKTPALETWKEEVIPAVLEPFIAKDAMDSGAARRVVAGSGEDLMTNLSSMLSQYLYSGEQAQKDRQVSGLSSALNYSAFPTNLLSSIMNLGTTEQGGAQTSTQLGLTTLLNLLNTSMGTKAYDPIIQGPQESLLSQLLPAAGAATGAYLGGPAMEGK